MNRISYREYQKLFTQGIKSYKSPYYIRYLLLDNNNNKTIIKTAVKRSLGNAVKRNYEKRVIRHIVKDVLFSNNYLIVIICCHKNDFSFKLKRQKILQQLQPIIQSEI